jgi:hypothetical protein
MLRPSKIIKVRTWNIQEGNSVFKANKTSLSIVAAGDMPKSVARRIIIKHLRSEGEKHPIPDRRLQLQLG